MDEQVAFFQIDAVKSGRCARPEVCAAENRAAPGKICPHPLGPRNSQVCVGNLAYTARGYSPVRNRPPNNLHSERMMLSRISVNVLLKSVISALALGVVVLLGIGAWSSWNRVAAATRIHAVAEASGYLFTALHNLRVDRATTIRELSSEQPVTRRKLHARASPRRRHAGAQGRPRRAARPPISGAPSRR